MIATEANGDLKDVGKYFFDLWIVFRDASKAKCSF